MLKMTWVARSASESQINVLFCVCEQMSGNIITGNNIIREYQHSQSLLYSETTWGSLLECPPGCWCQGYKSGCTPHGGLSSLPENMEQIPASAPGNITVLRKLQMTSATFKKLLSKTNTFLQIVQRNNFWLLYREQQVTSAHTLWSFSSNLNVARK